MTDDDLDHDVRRAVGRLVAGGLAERGDDAILERFRAERWDLHRVGDLFAVTLPDGTLVATVPLDTAAQATGALRAIRDARRGALN